MRRGFSFHSDFCRTEDVKLCHTATRIIAAHPPPPSYRGIWARLMIHRHTNAKREMASIGMGVEEGEFILRAVSIYLCLTHYITFCVLFSHGMCEKSTHSATPQNPGVTQCHVLERLLQVRNFLFLWKAVLVTVWWLFWWPARQQHRVPN